jgi:hypothetical protein
MLNSFDTIQWILEQSDPLSIECPAWVVKQVILNLLSRSLVQLTGKTNEKKILTQFTSSETEVSFHWQENGEGADTSMIRRRSGFNLSGQTPPVFNLTLCELLLARYQGRIVLPEDAPGLITVTFPRVSQL